MFCSGLNEEWSNISCLASGILVNTLLPIQWSPNNLPKFHVEDSGDY